MKIAILGAGAWGTALAISFGENHDVRLWARNPVDCEWLLRDRASRYLPDARLPAPVRVESALARAISDAEVALVAVSTAGLRETAGAVAAIGAPPGVVWACKGFESASGLMPHQIVAQVLPKACPVGALSGPSFAQEVARGLPAAVVLASGEAQFAASTAAALNGPRLRIYSSTDLIGVELGGALKNVIAIAAGIADGLSLGRNARAALITRGLAEIMRLGVAMGGQAQTFMGLAGLGDLVLTCTGDLSRNREVGVRLARGATLDEVLGSLGHVAEGVNSARAALEYARRFAVEMPVTEAVCRVLFEGTAPAAAVELLLSRDPRPE